MGCNGGFGGNCLWILIIIILFSCCGSWGTNYSNNCGNSCGNGCGC